MNIAGITQSVEWQGCGLDNQGIMVHFTPASRVFLFLKLSGLDVGVT